VDDRNHSVDPNFDPHTTQALTHIRKQTSILEATQRENNKRQLSRLVLQGRPMGGELLEAHVSPRAHDEVDGDGVAQLQGGTHA